MITKEEIQKLAELARIDVTGEELEGLTSDLDNILEHVSVLNEATGEGEEIVPEHRNVFRADENPHESGVYTKELLHAAPHTNEGYIEVSRVITEE